VGTGFHPELTGRENIFLNGAIMGMMRREIARKFDEIVAFADVEKFLDTPVKRYSSGMYVRLAFAVAAHMEPDILIVDEVLAVGDVAFQEKCLGKMKEVSRSRGRTVLFVSHNMAAISHLCSKALLLNAGRVVNTGPAAEMVQEYLHAAQERSMLQKTELHSIKNEWLQILSVETKADQGTNNLTTEDGFSVMISAVILKGLASIHFELFLTSSEGVLIFNVCSTPQALQPGAIEVICRIPGGLLNDGLYNISIGAVRNHNEFIAKVDDVVCVRIQDGPREISWFGKWPGAIRPRLEWEINQATRGGRISALLSDSGAGALAGQ
jgi:lipopolysaccharide transport system ATP-binding protein